MYPLNVSLEGPDPGALLRAVAAWPLFLASPARVEVDGGEVPGGAGWIDGALTSVHDEIFARWDEWGEHSMTYSQRYRIVLAMTPEWTKDPLAESRRLGAVPFQLAAFGTLFRDAWQETGWYGLSFGFLHRDFGWGCAFAGTGHRRVVSRRWLENGPWRLHRWPGDISLIQFHDLGADPATALRQATPGHRMLGITPESGYIYPEHEFRHEISGLYEAAERRLKIVVVDREVPVDEMLDACVLRAMPPKNPTKPIERIAYVFMEEAAARRHLHDLWLRELECWFVGPAGETRLDEDYHPPPEPPAW